MGSIVLLYDFFQAFVKVVGHCGKSLPTLEESNPFFAVVFCLLPCLNFRPLTPLQRRAEARPVTITVPRRNARLLVWLRQVRLRKNCKTIPRSLPEGRVRDIVDVFVKAAFSSTFSRQIAVEFASKQLHTQTCLRLPLHLKLH